MAQKLIPMPREPHQVSRLLVKTVYIASLQSSTCRHSC